MGAKIFKFILSAAALSAMTLSTAAAQSGPGNSSDSQSGSIFDIPEKYQKTYIDAGAGILTWAPYHGSDKQRVSPFPFISAEYKGRWFANPFNGAGVYVLNSKKYNLSGSVNYNPGRKASDTPFDMEIFQLDPGLALKANGRVRFKYFAIGADMQLPVLGDVKGAKGSVRAATLIPLGDQLSIVPSVAAFYESGKRLDRIYGINSAQSMATGLPQLTYKGGISGYSLALAGYWQSADKKYQVLGGLSYRELSDDLQISPLVDENHSVLAGIGIAKRY